MDAHTLTTAHPRRACWLGLILPAVVASACSLFEPEAIRVEIGLSADTVSLTSPIEVTVTVFNDGAEVATVNQHPCPPRYEIWERGSTPVETGLILCNLIAYPPVELSPGESFSSTYQWAGRRLGGDRDALPPGTYRLRGWTWVSQEKAFGAFASVRVVATGP